MSKPSHLHWLTPYLTVKDCDAAIHFYESAFGFEVESKVPDDSGKTSHVSMKWQGLTVMMFGREGAYGGNTPAPVTSGARSSVALYTYCPDVDAMYMRATVAGAKGEVAPMDTFYGDRMCVMTDPDGHVWNFATPKAMAA